MYDETFEATSIKKKNMYTQDRTNKSYKFKTQISIGNPHISFKIYKKFQVIN